MKITLDEHGLAMSDVKALEYVNLKVKNNASIHTSQSLVIDLARAALLRMPEKDRPDVEWEIYGKQITLDKHLRSFDLGHDPRENIWNNALHTLISGGKR